MATITMTSKAAAMYIITPVAAVTVVRRLFMLCQIRPMTLGTIDFTVLALERKLGLGIVIKGPQQPGIRVVALTTLLSHAALVGLIRLMTGKAGRIGLLKFGTQVTGLTSGNAVNTDQGKTGDVMLEKELYIPPLFIVTITAILTQFILVDIYCPMAGNTISRFKIIHRHAAMTGRAD
jgi:hypothetical protein